MNINFNDFFNIDQGEPFEQLVQVWIGTAIVDEKIISMTKNTSEQHFKKISSQISRENRPMKVKISYKYYMPYEKINEDYIEFTNKIWDNAYKAEGDL